MKKTRLYTKKGDNGTTTFLHDKKRYGKDSQLAQALGALDETNSLLGICRAKTKKCMAHNINASDILFKTQNNLFTLQAIVAGANMQFNAQKLKDMENDIYLIEKALPEINSFLIPGESELGAFFDFARATARRAEREVIALQNQGFEFEDTVLAYINRLSTLLYALARLYATNTQDSEQAPTYS